MKNIVASWSRQLIRIIIVKHQHIGVLSVFVLQNW